MPVFALVYLVLLLVAPAATTAAPHERDGLVIGFNVGGGSARIRSDEGGEEDGGGGSGGLRLGWAFDDRFQIGLESASWGNHEGAGNVNLNAGLIRFTWYPAASGFFLRTGLGVGEAEVTFDLGGRDLTFSDSGGAFGLGAGHEWRLGAKFALGAAMDYHTFSVDGGEFDFLNFTVQLNWYF